MPLPVINAAAPLNTNDEGNAGRPALLILSDACGAVEREAAPPKR